MNKNELYHHGVKGQKWGVRKKYDTAKSRGTSHSISKHTSKNGDRWYDSTAYNKGGSSMNVTGFGKTRREAKRNSDLGMISFMAKEDRDKEYGQSHYTHSKQYNKLIKKYGNMKASQMLTKNIESGSGQNYVKQFLIKDPNAKIKDIFGHTFNNGIDGEQSKH